MNCLSKFFTNWNLQINYGRKWRADETTKRLRIRYVIVPPDERANLLLILKLLPLDVQEVGLNHALRLEELLWCRVEQRVHLQSPRRAELRERVRRPQPLRLRPRPRLGTLLSVLPTQHREEHAVLPREALDLRHGRRSNPTPLSLSLFPNFTSRPHGTQGAIQRPNRSPRDTESSQSTASPSPDRSLPAAPQEGREDSIWRAKGNNDIEKKKE